MPGGLIFIVLMIAVIYMLLFRPQQRRRQQLQSLHASLSVGDEVLTASGIYGTVERIDDDVVEVRVAPEVTMRMARRAIMSIERDENEPLTAPEPETAPESEPVEREPR